MRLPVQPRTFGLRFNITPLIDIVFLLIIFFLVSSHFSRSETHEQIELPEAAGGTDDDSGSQNRLTITVRDDGSLFVSGRRIDGRQLQSRIVDLSRDPGSRPEVRIRGDRDVPYRQIEPIMLECVRLGISNVKTAVVDTDP